MGAKKPLSRGARDVVRTTLQLPTRPRQHCIKTTSRAPRLIYLGGAFCTPGSIAPQAALPRRGISTTSPLRGFQAVISAPLYPLCNQLRTAEYTNRTRPAGDLCFPGVVYHFLKAKDNKKSAGRQIGLLDGCRLVYSVTAWQAQDSCQDCGCHGNAQTYPD